MLRPSLRLLARLAAVALVATGCARDERPSLLLVTLDTTRADRLGFMGDAAARTPALDALAARGVVFERAYASAPRTLPSHATMLTGLEPYAHGLHDNGAVLPADVETATERLRDAGYATAAFVAAFVLDGVFGLARGFELYDDEIEWDSSSLDFTVPQLRGETVTDRALAWLEAGPEQPFFLWAHYYDPHTPRDPPPPFDEAEDAYAAEIAYMDAQVGRLLAGAERATRGRELVVLVVGDHGESLGEHDENTHGMLAYDSTLHVPLLAAGPGFPAGVRSAAFVQTRDVAPTLLASAGTSAAGLGGGRALQTALKATDPGERHGYFESVGPELNLGWARIGGVRSARWKYTAEPAPPELYDVLADPGETENRAQAAPEIVAQLAARYAELRRGERASQSEALGPEVRARLEALGYISAPVRFEGPAPDPRRLVGAMNWVEGARGLAARGRVADAIRALEILATKEPLRAVTLRSLAPVYLAAGRSADAVAAYEELTARTGLADFRLFWSQALLADGRPEEALDALGAPREGPPDRRAALLRAQALLLLGRAREGLAEVEPLLASDPHDDAALATRSAARVALEGEEAEIERLRSELLAQPEGERLVETRLALATLLSRAGRDAEAAALLDATLDPTPPVLARRAELAARHGNLERAAALYEQALAREPHRQAWLFELADLYRDLGRTEEALALYDELAAVSPEDAVLQLERGVALFGAQRWDDAAAAFRRAAELDAERPEAWFNLGLVELRLGQEDAAEASFRRAVALRPSYAKAHLELARLYRRRGDPRAAQHAEKAASSAPAGPM